MHIKTKMIINEKYLQDIDDEDDDVAVSDEIANNRFDFEVTLEYDKDVPIWGYTDSGECPDELPGLSTDDFLDYKDRLEIILVRSISFKTTPFGCGLKTKTVYNSILMICRSIKPRCLMKSI